MIPFDNVQVKNALNVAFLMLSNETGEGLIPNYFQIDYKSNLSNKRKNVYVEDGDGGGYPKVHVNILETLKVGKEFVEMSVDIIGAMLLNRDEKGEFVDKSEVELYGELYGMVSKFWGYLHGMKHTKQGTKVSVFKMGDLVMENDGYKIADEILLVEGKFTITTIKPKSWDCMIYNWSVGGVPSFLTGKYNPNGEDKPFADYDLEFFIKK
jgi:hypothetical protein